METKSYEEHMKDLQLAVEKMQRGNLSMEEMISCYRSAAESAKACLALLKKSEDEIRVVSADVEQLMKETESERD